MASDEEKSRGAVRVHSTRRLSITSAKHRFRNAALPIAVVLLPAQSAFAYTDPGSGLLLLQLVGSAVLGGLFYLHRLRARLFALIRGKKDAGDAKRDHS